MMFLSFFFERSRLISIEIIEIASFCDQQIDKSFVQIELTRFVSLFFDIQSSVFAFNVQFANNRHSSNDLKKT